MKRAWIEFLAERPYGPMTLWVHRPVGLRRGQFWNEAKTYEPPFQRVVAGRGYPRFHVECNGFVFVFTSLAELDVCIATLGTKLLPRALDLVRASGTKCGPSAHWLSRLPSRVRGWRYRERAVRYLSEAREGFATELES